MEKDSLKELRENSYNYDLLPMVSVVMIAYNVEKYLAEAIESVVNQRTNFKVELIIGEDCSKDNTRNIALEYQSKFPHLIRVLLPEKNQGLTPNCITTHNACKGKYIALLDGDDYWTDINKLQKQITFLEENIEFTGCGHQSMKIYDDNSVESSLIDSIKDEIYTLNDTITYRKFHTSSLVYRKEIWDKTGGIPKNISSNERAIYPMIAIYGKIKYFKEPMCVYRFSGFGLSSRIDYLELETDLNMLPWLKTLSPNFPISKFKSFIHFSVYTYGTSKMPKTALIKHFTMFFIYSFSYFPKNTGDLKWGIILFFRAFFK